MRRPLPPHIAWPLFVVAILMMSVSAVVVTIVAAHSDGGAQVMAEYHGQATSWDEQARQQAASDQLGWHAQVSLHGVGADGLRIVHLTLTDRNGASLTGLTGTVRLERPQLAQPIAELPWVPMAGAPGTYELYAPIDAPGLWDFHIRATQGSDLFLMRVRKEVVR